MFVKATFPALGLKLVLFFLCCLRHSQLEGQENRSGKLLRACHQWLQDGSARLCMVWAASRPCGSQGQGQAWIMLSQGGRHCVCTPYSRPCFCIHARTHLAMQPCQHSSCGETRGSSTRQPEVARILCKLSALLDFPVITCTHTNDKKLHYMSSAFKILLTQGHCGDFKSEVGVAAGEDN